MSDRVEIELEDSSKISIIVYASDIKEVIQFDNFARVVMQDGETYNIPLACYRKLKKRMLNDE